VLSSIFKENDASRGVLKKYRRFTGEGMRETSAQGERKGDSRLREKTKKET